MMPRTSRIRETQAVRDDFRCGLRGDPVARGTQSARSRDEGLHVGPRKVTLNGTFDVRSKRAGED